MKKIVLITALFALSFATGFTCSKNAPEQTATPEVAAPAAPEAGQAEMAAPVEGQAPVSADATAPSQPATETK